MINKNIHLTRQLTVKLNAWLKTSLALLILISSTLAFADDKTSVYDDMRKLLGAEDYQAAYVLGSRYKLLQGEPHFDYLYGIAAINSGYLPQGILALERYLKAVPTNDRARLELAKGYYEIGAYARARQEFEFVLRYNPPANVRNKIQQYLDAMQADSLISKRNKTGSYFELTAGYDSNSNAGTYNNEIEFGSNTPDLAVRTAITDPDAKENPSRFVQLTLGSQFLRRVGGGLGVYAGLDLDTKHYFSAQQFDTDTLAAYTGFSFLKGIGLYRLTLSGSKFFVGGNEYRNTLSWNGEARYDLGSGYEASGIAQYSELKHADASSSQDATVFTLGLGLSKQFNTSWKPRLVLRTTWSQDSNLNQRVDLDKQTKSLRLSASVTPSAKSNLALNLAYQTADYADSFSNDFKNIREDELWQTSLNYSYLLNKKWLWRTSLSWAENDSTRDIFPYRRGTASMSLRYLF
ncbi:hypothetical protein C2869_09310 [Saccharobesus litoralis]|uniref:Uncharacterized protein n=1 Tax=Saccharobesus litoralis TaxID=2172099 RepID=A0A2S0VQX0_9ALTE|nr:hypothetical protein [Saccharobesus litoralis]AWB66615.1 hypothetical protein C2869_09310 [Saccharobesus litoralis]